MELNKERMLRCPIDPSMLDKITNRDRTQSYDNQIFEQKNVRLFLFLSKAIWYSDYKHQRIGLKFRISSGLTFKSTFIKIKIKL